MIIIVKQFAAGGEKIEDYAREMAFSIEIQQ